MFPIFITGLIIPILSFILQIRPRLYNRYFGVDTWRHLMLADYIRQHKRLPDVIKDKYLVEGPYDYPPTLLVILSLFPKKFLEKYQWLISPIFDFIHNLLLFVLVYLLTKNLFMALVAQIVYSLTPIVVLENSNLNTRSLGALILTLAFFPLLLYSIYGNPILLVVAVLFSILLFFSHRFSTQVLFFLSICFTLYEQNILYFGIFLLSGVGALVLSKGYYLRILRGHILLLKLWFKNIERRFAHQVRGVEKAGGSDFITRSYRLSCKMSPVTIMASNPWIIFIPLALILKDRFYPGISQVLFSKLVIWSIVTFLLAIATTWIKSLRFLGEGQRYLESGAFPTALISAFFISKFLLVKYHPLGILIPLLFAGGLLGGILYIQKKAIIEDTNRTITPALWKVIEFLRQRKEGVRIACLPHALADAIMYFTPSKTLLTDNSTGNWKLLDFWPTLQKPFPEIAKKYHLNYLLVNENYVKISELKLPSSHVALRIENLYLLKLS